jgi:cytochrome oxidase assembly protein ShyY1
MKAFKPGVRMSVFVLLFLPILLALGNWQLQRGALKRELESNYLQQLTRLPMDLQKALDGTATSVNDALPLAPFTRVRLSGHYAKQRFFLDNQISDGQVGYWLFQAFVMVDGGKVLVNRGFVAAATQRDNLPTVASPQGEVTIIASLWPDLGLPPLLQEHAWTPLWPKRIQRRNLSRMAVAAGTWASELRLEPGQTGALQAAPFAQTLSDAKHRGYALTWFGLAAALFFGYIAYGFRKPANDTASTN